jgi:hypothetical protein
MYWLGVDDDFITKKKVLEESDGILVFDKSETENLTTFLELMILVL